jgi:hypothetical protein
MPSPDSPEHRVETGAAGHDRRIIRPKPCKTLSAAVSRFSCAGWQTARKVFADSKERVMKFTMMALIATAILASPPAAFAQRGPVRAACAADIEIYCKGLPHVNRAVRICLEENKDKVRTACREALNATGWGYRQGYGGRGNQPQ